MPGRLNNGKHASRHLTIPAKKRETLGIHPPMAASPIGARERSKPLSGAFSPEMRLRFEQSWRGLRLNPYHAR